MTAVEWTGAVGNYRPASGFDSDLILKTVSEIQFKAPGTLISDPDALDFLLYVAAEWKDSHVAERLKIELSNIADRISKEGVVSPFLNFSGHSFEIQARLIRIFCDAAVFFKCVEWDFAAQKLVQFLESFYDLGRGVFGDQDALGPAIASQNALAAWAFLAAWPRFQNNELQSKAESALRFIQKKLYDPLLGLIHQLPSKESALEYGYLGDCAWAALAMSEAYLQNWDKSHRDFADALAKYMFQELWDREKGGFIAQIGTEEISTSVSQKNISENAVAFEALWRLRYLKGNNSYSKWIDLGLHRFLDGTSAQIQRSSLLKIQDMSSRGRIELEIVGRPQEEIAQKMLKALAFFYAPRKIISFIDPDDQDYILAHGLEAESYPRLFGCVDLKKRAETADPAMAGAVLNAAWYCN